MITPGEVEVALQRMAAVVDRQNEVNPAYRPMAADPEGSLAFQAARVVILEGQAQPPGYAEPLLHALQLRLKGER